MRTSPEQLNFFDPIEEQVRPASGNRNLVAYGIEEEKSDYRVHVTGMMRVYSYPTKSGQEALWRVKAQGWKPKSVFTGNIETARGYAVPLSYIDHLQETIIPPQVWRDFPFDNSMTTSAKGLQATRLVVALLEKSLIPLPVRVQETERWDLQISGTDIMINASLHLQVKCDLPGGEKRDGGTGNLFIQVAECNPFKRY